jgi:uncharacterized flavoprotein (TIGR03862 family)
LSPHIAIIGGGPAGLIAAETLAAAGKYVTVYDRMPSVGRKFLMAGRGGLNLTHSEPLDKFLTRYGKAAPLLAPAIQEFSPSDLVTWCENLGQSTFTGTSGRVFPESFKASPLLRAWLTRLQNIGVQFKLQQRWTGWDSDGNLTFQPAEGDPVPVHADAVILALGGASWPRLGSDGHWTHILENKGIPVSPLRPANCGLIIPWSDIFRTRFVGHPLKSIVLSYGNTNVPGELMITSKGLEGTPAYTLSGAIRDDLASGPDRGLTLDLRPGLSLADLTAKLGVPRKRQSLSTFLQKAVNLPPPAIGLVQEVMHQKTVSDTPASLAALIKALPLQVSGTSGLERAISSAGGIAFDALTPHLMLKALPGVFAAGEMLDWEAPTGGYLLQASFGTGIRAAHGALAWLDSWKG